jgi:hypothetical protein
MTPSSNQGPRPGSGWLRVEDGLLAGWSLALPAVGGWFGSTSTPPGLEGGGAWAGFVQLLAVLGAFAALLTRPTDQPPVRVGEVEAPRIALSGPLIGGLAFAAAGAIEGLGLPSGDWLIAISFVVLLIGILAASHLPVVSAPLRRLFVLPFILVSSTYFNGFAGTVLGSLDIGSLDIGELIAQAPAASLSFALFLLVLILGGMAAFYAMFVVAPRELADPEGRALPWIARFIVYMAASLTGLSWLRIVSG